jgi:hypothetical protein
MCVCVPVCGCMGACMCTCQHASTYVCMYVCINACVNCIYACKCPHSRRSAATSKLSSTGQTRWSRCGLAKGFANICLSLSIFLSNTLNLSMFHSAQYAQLAGRPAPLAFGSTRRNSLPRSFARRGSGSGGGNVHAGSHSETLEGGNFGLPSHKHIEQLQNTFNSGYVANNYRTGSAITGHAPLSSGPDSLASCGLMTSPIHSKGGTRLGSEYTHDSPAQEERGRARGGEQPQPALSGPQVDTNKPLQSSDASKMREIIF